MALPAAADYVIIGAGIHGLSTAESLAKRLQAQGKTPDIVVIDKQGIAAGASGIACGVVRNNYFQPAMRELMAHSVACWEADAEKLSYHPVGYLQISCEAMRSDVGEIHRQQAAIGYESTFVEGEAETAQYMRGLFDDWQARGVTSVLHEKPGGYANNTSAIYRLADRAEAAGVRIVTGVAVTGIERDQQSQAVRAVETDRGAIACQQLVVAVGPWVRDIWAMLELPQTVSIRDAQGRMHDDIPMWRFWQLEEGVLGVEPEMLRTNDGALPPVVHIDSDAPLISDVDGSVISDETWGIYYKPDTGFGGIQGGAMPYKVDKPANDVAIDPYGPSSPEFIASDNFAHMWCSALAFCHKRFEGMTPRYRNEASGGIGCFTPDSFPVFDQFYDNAYIIADSNHGYKMIGVGELVAQEMLGEKSSLLAPFRLQRYEKGDLHPVSNSPFPWS